jgi:threonine/homoserine/homoserine lactone efflux protein
VDPGLAPALVAAGTVFALGAISPGPSLAVVLRNTFEGGRRRGVACAIGHGLGFGIYAMLAVFSLVAVMGLTEHGMDVMRLLGAAVLLLFASWSWPKPTPEVDAAEVVRDQGGRNGFAEGMTIAVLNPKIAVFMVAVLSQVLDPSMPWSTRVAVGLLGMTIDTTWYLVVALLLSSEALEARLKAQRDRIGRILATTMVLLACWTVWTTLVS